MKSELSSSRKLRVGAVSYLNTKPLIYRFAQFARNAELVLDLPSCLADGLACGDLDVALIPSIECFQNPGYTIVSDACIGCRGPVLSVKWLSRVPLDTIRTLALDEGSRTSGALVQVLLQQQFGLSPEIEPLPIGSSMTDTRADAVLLIGDRAIHSPAGGFVAEWDLGAEWCRWSRLPFVFAMWTAREGVDTTDIGIALGRARDAGVAHLEEIALAEAAGVGMDDAACVSYLRDNLYFHLGAREQQGLQLFYDYAARLGLAPSDRGPTTIGLTVP